MRDTATAAGGIQADHLIERFFALSLIGMAISDPVTRRWVRFNDRMAEMLGYSRDELAGKSWDELTHPDDLPANVVEFARTMRGEIDHYRLDKRYIRKDGSALAASIDVRAVRDGQGRVQFFFTTVQDRSAQVRGETTDALRAGLLERLADEVPLADLLADAARALERALPGALVSILLLDAAGERLRHGAAPSLPPAYNAAIDGTPIGPGVGACGSAAYLGQRVVSRDIAHDPAWAAFAALAREAGVAACWSEPILGAGRVVLGTFAVYRREPHEPGEDEIAFVTTATHYLAMAIERHRAHGQLRLAASVFEQAGEAITITDAGRNILMVNRAFTTISGYSAAEVIGCNPRLLSSGRQSKAFYDGMWRTLAERGAWQGEVWNRRKDGSLYLGWLSISVVRDTEGRVTNYLGTFTDVTQHRAAEERIRRLAHFDSLTGLPNRTLLADRVEQALSMARRAGEPLVLMFVDLDHFKNVNDTLGHRIGDAVLLATAKRLENAVREQDTVARLGGDEFVVVLPKSDANGASTVARKLLAVAAEPYVIEGHELTVTPSVGIAIFPDDGTDFDALARAADAAMYRAKQAGRNAYCYYTPEMQVHSARALQLDNALRRALEREQLMLNYQPQLSIHGDVIGVEALLRWKHPELGWVSPAEFIPIAENSGQILPIGEWVMRTAARQLAAWIAGGLPPMIMAVNLSAVQFRHPSLPEVVGQVLAETGLPEGLLELELTERVAMDDPKGAIATMTRLRERGVCLSIDDFGTGYSSLSYLKRFPVYKLKIDQSFVRDLGDDPEDRAIVVAVIQLAASLGLRTIAEGVETAQQLDFLRLQGCEEVQGYFFAKPLPADGLEAFLRARLAQRQASR